MLIYFILMNLNFILRKITPMLHTSDYCILFRSAVNTGSSVNCRNALFKYGQVCCKIWSATFYHPAVRTVVSDGRYWTRQSDWIGYFNLAVPMRKCLGNHSCTSYTFSIAILNRTCFLRHQYSFVVTCLL